MHDLKYLVAADFNLGATLNRQVVAFGAAMIEALPLQAQLLVVCWGRRLRSRWRPGWGGRTLQISLI